MELHLLNGAAATGDVACKFARDVRLPRPGWAVEHYLPLVIEEPQRPGEEVLGEIQLIREHLQRCFGDVDAVQQPPRELLYPPRIIGEVRIQSLPDPVIAGDGEGTRRLLRRWLLAEHPEDRELADLPARDVVREPASGICYRECFHHHGLTDATQFMLAADAVIQPVRDLARPVEQIAERFGDRGDAVVGLQQGVVPGLDTWVPVRLSRQPAQQLASGSSSPSRLSAGASSARSASRLGLIAARVVDFRAELIDQLSQLVHRLPFQETLVSIIVRGAPVSAGAVPDTIAREGLVRRDGHE